MIARIVDADSRDATTVDTPGDHELRSVRELDTAVVEA